MIGDGDFWKKLVSFDEHNYLISASTPGEDRWTEQGRKEKEDGLCPGHAYSVIQAKNCQGHQLVNLRNPWGFMEWDGDWGDKSHLWTPSIKKELGAH